MVGKDRQCCTPSFRAPTDIVLVRTKFCPVLMGHLYRMNTYSVNRLVINMLTTRILILLNNFHRKYRHDCTIYNNTKQI